MSQLLTKFFFQKTVLVLRVQGVINTDLLAQINRQLKNYYKGNTIALAIVINSEGGCQYSVEALQKKIKAYATNVPIYTFATEKALGNAYSLLQLGQKSFAQTTSMIGQTQLNYEKLKLQDFLSYYGVNIHRYQSNNLPNHNLLENSSFASLNQKDLEHIEKFYAKNTHQLTEQCFKEYNQKIKIKKDDLKNQILLGEDAQKVGLIDDIGTYEKILMELYPNAKILPTNQDGKLREYENWFNLFIKVSQSRGFLGLMLILFIKGTIKWLLILYVWRQSRKQKRLQKEQEQQATQQQQQQ